MKITSNATGGFTGTTGSYPYDINSVSPKIDEEYYEDFYNYTYDYNAALNHLPLDEVLPTAIFYGIVGIVGLLGNVLVILAIAKFPRMRSITNAFLLSLASADLMIILICVPVKGLRFFTYTWQMGSFMCTFYAYVQNVSLICSVMTLTVMSIERFMAILFPLKARYLCTMRHAKIVILCVWVQSFVMAIPIIFGQKHIEVGLVRKAYWCRIEFPEPVYHQIYEMYMFIIMFLIPVGVMAVTYTIICIEIWIVVSKRAVMRSGSECNYKEARNSSRTSSSISTFSSNMSNRRHPPSSFTKSDDAKTRKQVIVMLIIVVALFAICWGPILINNVLVAFGVLDSFHVEYLKPMRIAFHLMSYANSCVNPIVYGFMSKNFRDSFVKALMPCVKRKVASGRIVTDTTRASILKSSNGSDDKDNGFMTSETTCTTPTNGNISLNLEDIEMN